MQTKYESTIRMDNDLATRLDVIAQVLDTSKNQLIVSAVQEAILFYESDPEFKSKRHAWLERLAGAAQ